MADPGDRLAMSLAENSPVWIQKVGHKWPMHLPMRQKRSYDPNVCNYMKNVAGQACDSCNTVSGCHSARISQLFGHSGISNNPSDLKNRHKITEYWPNYCSQLSDP